MNTVHTQSLLIRCNAAPTPIDLFIPSIFVNAKRETLTETRMIRDDTCKCSRIKIIIHRITFFFHHIMCKSGLRYF